MKRRPERRSTAGQVYESRRSGGAGGILPRASSANRKRMAKKKAKSRRHRKKAAGALNKSLTAAVQVQQGARVLTQVIRQLEQRETALKKVPVGGRAAVVETGNLVTGAFAAAGD